MKKWTKEEAIKSLVELADETNYLSQSTMYSTEHTLWMTKCMVILEEVFGRASRWYLSFASLKWHPIGSFITRELDVEAVIDAKNNEAFQRDIGAAKGLLLGAIDYLKDREITEVFVERETGNEANMVFVVLSLVEKKLRKVIRNKPDKEKQVQDKFEDLLIGADVSYGREVDSIEYSTKTYTPDFSLTELNLAVEIKLCAQAQREKDLPEEINDDILAYKKKYQNLIFVVYDLGFIRDVDRFCGSFEEHDNVTVRVIKH